MDKPSPTPNKWKLGDTAWVRDVNTNQNHKGVVLDLQQSIYGIVYVNVFCETTGESLSQPIHRVCASEEALEKQITFLQMIKQMVPYQPINALPWENEIEYITVEQNLDMLKHQYHTRSDNHRFKSNNWLKSHGQPMRRKPFKKEKFIRYMLDELCNIYSDKFEIKN